MDHWQYFNWKNIISEARMRHADAAESSAAAITPEKRTLEYWTAWCAHANLAACTIEQQAQASSSIYDPPKPSETGWIEHACPECDGMGRRGVLACMACGATGQRRTEQSTPLSVPATECVCCGRESGHSPDCPFGRRGR